MKALQATAAAVLIGAMSLSPGTAVAQAPGTISHVAHIDKQLAEKQAALDAHRKQMETITDRRALDTEMRKHFQMTEEVLALMLERRNAAAATPGGSAPTGPPTTTAPGQSGGMQGGMMEHGMGGGMMQREMGGMQGGMMQKEMGGMQGSMPGMGSASPTTTPAPTAGDMDQMMKRIADHSTYMETVTDSATLQREMLRHQKMVDQMMQLMQK